MHVRQDPVFALDIVERLQAGRLAPAAMQRPYVWSKQDVLDLFDAMLLGFPIGSILLWSPGKSAPIERYSKGRIAHLSKFDHGVESLILDGQNRIATFAWSLVSDFTTINALDVPDHERSVWLDGTRLVLDCRNNQFAFVNSEALRNAQDMLIPTSALLGGSMSIYLMSLFRGLTSQQRLDVEPFIETCDQAQRAIMSSKMIVSNLVNATVEEAKNAFCKICRTGVPMSDADFDTSVAWSHETAERHEEEKSC